MIENIKRRLLSINRYACPVGDKAKMLIWQIRSFGSLGKGLVCMPCISSGKPKDPFRAPTYFLGRSNFSLHGRVGLLILRLANMTFISNRRIKNKIFIKDMHKIINKSKKFSNLKVCFKS